MTHDPRTCCDARVDFMSMRPFRSPFLQFCGIPILLRRKLALKCK